MRWYDEYAQECFEDCWHKDDDDCWRNDDRYSFDCLYCDYFNEYLTDMDMFNERIDYCDYDSEHEYIKTVEFANHADDLICDEECRWWWGFRGTFESIRAGAIDPRDYDNEESYTYALHEYLFGEIIDRFPFVPNSDDWQQYFSACLEETDSISAATQLLLDHYKDLYDTEFSVEQLLMMSQTGSTPPNNRERKFRPPSPSRWNYFRKRWEYDWYDDGIMRNGHYTLRPGRPHSKKQFLIEACAEYPELTNFITFDKNLEKLSEDEIDTQDYYFDVLCYALYFHEVFNFNLEDAIQDGVIGLRKAIVNGFWRTHFGYMTHREYIHWEIRVNIIRYSLQSQNIFGSELDRETAKQVEYHLSDISQEIFEKDLSKIRRQYDFDEWWDLKYKRKDFVEQCKSSYPSLFDKVQMFEENLDLLDCIPLYDIDYDTTWELCFINERNRILNRAVESLPEKDRNIIQLRYGLAGYEKASLEEIGQYYLVSRERVRQITLKAIEKIRKTDAYVPLCSMVDMDHMIPTFAKLKKFNIPALPTEPDEWSYDILRNKTIRLTDYKGESTHVIIPQQIKGYTVTALGDFFLSPNKPHRRRHRREVCKNVKSVQIPEGILVIGESAFENCKSLVEITVPDSVKEIKNRAFAYTAIHDFKIPEDLIRFGSDVFAGCHNL